MFHQGSSDFSEESSGCCRGRIGYRFFGQLSPFPTSEFTCVFIWSPYPLRKGVVILSPLGSPDVRPRPKSNFSLALPTLIFFRVPPT